MLIGVNQQGRLIRVPLQSRGIKLMLNVNRFWSLATKLKEKSTPLNGKEFSRSYFPNRTHRTKILIQ